MICRECQEHLLEAGPLEIAAGLEDAWGQHIQECAPCGALAAHILEAQADLAVALDALTAARPLAEATAAALRESAGRRRRVRQVSWGAAAAVAAAVLSIRAFGPGGGLDTGSVDVAARFYAGSASAPEVEAMLDESVVVLQTDNENVVVFWFYQGRGE